VTIVEMPVTASEGGTSRTVQFLTPASEMIGRGDRTRRKLQ